MRIGIVTLFNNVNYGNKFQNFAMQEILEEVTGAKVETLVPLYYIPTSFRQALSMFHLLLFNFYHWILKDDYWKKNQPFAPFTQKRLITYHYLSRYGKTPKCVARRFDYFVVGSDQVWNPGNRKKERDLFYLTFAERQQRKNIAPSLGVSVIPDEFMAEMSQLLNGFDSFSCREEEGCNLIKEITGKQAIHLLDPTMVYSKEKWMEIAEVIETPQRFALLAFLGPRNDNVNRVVEYLSHNGIEIINVFERDNFYTPEQMLYLIGRSDIILTDSFHFTAFSVNFNVPFVAFQRDGCEHDRAMFSRITSLLKMFGLEARIFSNDMLDNLWDVEFETSNCVLLEERKKFMLYVKNQFKS